MTDIRETYKRNLADIEATDPIPTKKLNKANCEVFVKRCVEVKNRCYDKAIIDGEIYAMNNVKIQELNNDNDDILERKCKLEDEASFSTNLMNMLVLARENKNDKQINFILSKDIKKQDESIYDIIKDFNSIKNKIDDDYEYVHIIV